MCCNGVGIFCSMAVWLFIGWMRKERRLSRKWAIFWAALWPIFFALAGILVAGGLFALTQIIMRGNIVATGINLLDFPEEFEGLRISGRAMFCNLCIGPIGFLLLWVGNVFAHYIKED